MGVDRSSKSFLLAGKCALVVGGGAGIGRATAFAFADEGADVVIGDVDEAGGKAASERVAERGRRSGFHRVDVTDRGSVERGVEAAAKDLGGIDIVVVTPMVRPGLSIVGLETRDWDRQFEVMARGTFFVFQAVIPLMQARGGGVLLATSSSHFGDYGAMTHGAIVPPYGCAKGAVEILVRTTARIHSSEGIRVNAVQPGFTMTEAAMASMKEFGMADIDTIRAALGHGMPMGPLEPEEVAEGFVFLASDYASYVTGYSLSVEGGGLASATGKLLPA